MATQPVTFPLIVMLVAIHAVMLVAIDAARFPVRNSRAD